MKLQEKIIKIWELITFKEQKNELKRIYSQVVEKFPSIKKEEITLTYDPIYQILGGDLKSPTFFGGNELIANMYFNRYSPQEKEALVAHELGHYGQLDRFGTDEEELKYQIEADSQAAEAGYCEELVKLLKQSLKEAKNQETKKRCIARIENLENKICKLNQENKNFKL